MPTLLSRLVQLVLAASVCLAIPAPPACVRRPRVQCQHLIINLEASAANRIIILNLTALNAAELIPKELTTVVNAASINITGQYQIAANYCAPLIDVPERRQTLQILVHGVTYTKTYWAGPATQDIGPGSTNQSWIHYAAKQGYPVLAVDRLCNGGSSHPSGIAECQLPLEAAVLEKIIQAARDGALPGVATKFDKIIYVGHSYGSMIGNYIVQSNPAAVDQLHLTGFSERLVSGTPGIILLPGWQPASLLDPARFFGLDLGYIIATDEKGSESMYFTDDIDPAVLDYDWKTRGSTTIGELMTSVLGQVSAPEFKGDVFVVNGDEDALFCAYDHAAAAAAIFGSCEASQASKEVVLSFPAARRFEYFNLPNTGHSLGLHRGASRAIAASHQFMAAAGF
ncbi:hypothetical protein LEL_01948 [Akanthomyces lecanii RCEF 1005]|uniref:AB hydrolase-1 domain-containing protein n=1 Tax=Akanthomyces lecanii RCEF 1005 TaxID=1081108 RepID=A0A168KXC1_CORDF|nr:hypothetical protein LEL_01948 [Akanthomyces lecanii RCEF 1005]